MGDKNSAIVPWPNKRYETLHILHSTQTRLHFLYRGLEAILFQYISNQIWQSYKWPLVLTGVHDLQWCRHILKSRAPAEVKYYKTLIIWGQMQNEANRILPHPLVTAELSPSDKSPMIMHPQRARSNPPSCKKQSRECPRPNLGLANICVTVTKTTSVLPPTAPSRLAVPTLVPFGSTRMECLLQGTVMLFSLCR